MCGIAGIIGAQNLKVIQDMVDVQLHRGPDDHGVFVDEKAKVALGNCRLAVIDLSKNGHMPMSEADNQVWIVYNGEIYNFQEIRTELESYGYNFISRTDTEVVLKAYLEWGEECLSRFRGMFAFAIYDNRPKNQKGRVGRLFLARDRFGIKPLYWVRKNGIFIFASELKSMLASRLVSRQVDIQALWDYLSFGSVPLPRTILSDVSSLPPAHYMLVEDGQVQIKHYWDIVEATTQRRNNPLKDLTEASRQLSVLLDETIKLHSISDVPLGVFLSGGVDSSTIVAFLNRHSSRPIKTFSVLFESNKSPTGELPWAKQIAERFMTDHTEVMVTSQQISNDFERIISSIDQPSLDGVNTFYVSQAARQAVTVAMSGLGSDEIFGGYGFFNRFTSFSRITEPLSKRYAAIRARFTEQQKKSVLNSELLRIFKPRPTPFIFDDWMRNELDSISQTTYVEMNGYLAHTLLRDTDVMSMAHSLEIRVPFLDHRLAEFVFSLPAEMKCKGSNNKKILIETAKNLIPAEILNREKCGFVIPWDETIGKKLYQRAEELFHSYSANKVFSQEYIKSILTDLKYRKNLMSHWPNIILLAWLEKNNCFAYA